MLRILVLAMVAVAVWYLVVRFAPRIRKGARALLNSPFARQMLLSVVLRIIRFLIFRR